MAYYGTPGQSTACASHAMRWREIENCSSTCPCVTDLWLDMCVHMCVDMCFDMCVGMGAGICVDTYVDVCVDMGE